jgi:hypothetical protein
MLLRMLRRRPDLIVPIRDRRQHRRYLTLKHFAVFVAVATVLFIIITVRSEMRGRMPGEFGRLFQHEVAADVEQKPVEVVREAPAVEDATHADPMLIQPAARAQWLQGDPTATTVAPVPPTAPPPVIRSSASEVAVVGGPDGVSIVRKEARPKPVLSGGFGR